MEIFSVSSIRELKEVYFFAVQYLSLSYSHPRSLNYYLEEYTKYPELLLVAKDQGKIIGVILRSIEGDHVLIGEIVVSPEYRNKGIGSKLLSSLEANSHKIGQSQILLGAKEEAEKFYLKNNYRPRLFVQITGNESKLVLDNLLSKLPNNYPVIWRDDSQKIAKAVIQTDYLDKELEKQINNNLQNIHTQYLFSKALNQ